MPISGILIRALPARRRSFVRTLFAAVMFCAMWASFSSGLRAQTLVVSGTDRDASAETAAVAVTLPADATGSTGSTFLMPINVSELPAHGAANEVFSYSFDLAYDPFVLSSPAAVTGGSLSNSPTGSLVSMSSRPGVFHVSFSDPGGITSQGALIWIAFTVGGGTGQQTALSFVSTDSSPAPFTFNSGDPSVTLNSGHFRVVEGSGAYVSITGRVVNAAGKGVYAAGITVSGAGSGAPRQTITNPFGYFRMNGLNAGDTYVVTVQSKRFKFTNPSRVVTLNENLDDMLFTADPLP